LRHARATLLQQPAEAVMTSEDQTARQASATADAATTTNFHDAADAALLGRVAEGEAQAQEKLAARLVLRVRRAAHALMRGSVDAEDAAQHALIEVLRAAHRYRGNLSIERWSDRITGASVIRFARAVRRRSALLDPAPADVESARGERPPRNLEECLSRLTEGPRETLLLRHVFGHTVEEIAELSQASPATVKDRLLAARRELRRLAVARQGPDDSQAVVLGSDSERWTALRDREALGEPLSAAELEELVAFEASDPEVLAYVAQMRELEGYLQAAREGRLTSADRELVRRALSAVRVTSPSARVRAVENDADLALVADPEGPGWIRSIATGMSVVMAVAAALALAYYEPRSVRRAGNAASKAAPEPEEEPRPLAPMVEALASARTSARGARLRRAGTLLAPGAPLGQGDVITSGERPGCFVIALESEVCLGANSAVKLTDLTATSLLVELEEGRATANLKPTGVERTFAITSGPVRVTALGTVFGVERNVGVSQVRVRVLRGKVRLDAGAQATQLDEARGALFRTEEGTLDVVELLPALAQREWDLVRTAQPGAAFVASHPTAAAPARDDEVPSSDVVEAGTLDTAAELRPADEGGAPRELMQQAWELLKAERWPEAAAVYERIHREHARSEEAHIVLVRLGDLLLERLAAPERALAVFERYLHEGGGPLEAEARYGRITAYRRLSRRGEERAAIEEFLRTHASSPKAAMLEARLRVLAETN
jgi:RNA polymerase sigma-70 factor (ECF subfamily)